MNKYTFTTSAGLEVSFTPPSATIIEEAEQGLRADLIEQGCILEPPTYELEVGGGTPEHPLTQTFEHTQDSLQSEEDKLKWAAYQSGLAKYNAELAQIRTDICLEALNIQLPEDDSWIQNQLEKHVKVPGIVAKKSAEDELYTIQVVHAKKLLMHYKRSEVLRTMSDIYDAVAQIVTSAYAGTTSDEARQVASKLFRDRLQEAALENARAAGGAGSTQ